MDATKKIYSTVIKQDSINPDAREINFVISDESPDSDGDIIEVQGWDFGRFFKNAVCMGFHEYDEFPFGKWTRIEKDMRSNPRRVIGTLKFPTIQELCPTGEVSEHAKNVDMAYAMCKAGYLNAVSVGCYYKAASPREDYPEGTPEYMRGRRVTSAELIEVSLVPIPANGNALSMLSADKNIDSKMIEYVSKSFNEHNEKQGVAKKAKEDAEAKEKAELESKAAVIETKIGARLSAATLAQIDELEGCKKELDEAFEACKSASDKMATMIKMLRDGASAEEPGEPVEEPDGDEVAGKSFVFHIVR
jgi:hypothetical protein